MKIRSCSKVMSKNFEKGLLALAKDTSRKSVSVTSLGIYTIDHV